MAAYMEPDDLAIRKRQLTQAPMQPQALATAVPGGTQITSTAENIPALPQIQPPAPQIQPPVGAVPGGTTLTEGAGNFMPRTNPAIPQTGGFGPGNNLIGQQINPVAFQPGQDTTGARGSVTNALQALEGTPNRQQLALETLKLLDEQTADTRKLGIQDIGRAGARLGRLGSGMVTTDLGNLEERLQRSRDQNIRALSTETAQQELDDRLKRLGGSQSVYDQLFGTDVTGANLAAGQRDELRGERGYQYGLDRQALEDRIREATLGNQFANDELQRQLGYGGLLGGYGYAAQSPVYQSLSNQYGQQSAASGDAAAQLLWQLAQRGGK